MNYQFTHDYIFSSEKFEKTFGMKPVAPKDGIAALAAAERVK